MGELQPRCNRGDKYLTPKLAINAGISSPLLLVLAKPTFPFSLIGRVNPFGLQSCREHELLAQSCNRTTLFLPKTNVCSQYSTPHYHPLQPEGSSCAPYFSHSRGKQGATCWVHWRNQSLLAPNCNRRASSFWRGSFYMLFDLTFLQAGWISSLHAALQNEKHSLGKVFMRRFLLIIFSQYQNSHAGKDRIVIAWNSATIMQNHLWLLLTKDATACKFVLILSWHYIHVQPYNLSWLWCHHAGHTL